MRRTESEKTLQLTRPYGQTLALAALILALLLAAAEGVTRLVEPHLGFGFPRLGSNHKQFEQQWFRLKQYAAQNGGVECVFIGDSTVMSNFSPLDMASAYQAQTGAPLYCFNFGVGGVSAEGIAAIARLLAQEYTPRLMLIGIEALNFTTNSTEVGNANVQAFDWVRFKLGDFTLRGWLYENVHLVRFMSVLQQVITFTADGSELALWSKGEAPGLERGFFPLHREPMYDVSQPPDPHLDLPYLVHYFAELGTFETLPENLDALDQVLTLNGARTQVVLVEMPVPGTFYGFFDGGEAEYRQMLDVVSYHAAGAGILFLQMEDLSALPDPFWDNYNHLSSRVAPVFSAWLGRTLGQSLQIGGASVQ